MAKIVENENGRRLVRLSTEDVLTVVSVYASVVNRGGQTPRTRAELAARLEARQFYLPEDI